MSDMNLKKLVNQLHDLVFDELELEEPLVSCLTCDKDFPTVADIVDHIRRYHPELEDRIFRPSR